MKNKKLYITLFIISLIILGIGGTLAAFTATATATNITQIKSGNLTMTIDGGGNVNASFMPAKCTSEYAIKKKIVASATNTSGGKVSFSIGMNVATLSDDLKRGTMKYALSTSTDSCTNGLVANGNFSNATVGSDIWIVKNDYDNITNTSNTYTKTYYLYIWLDEKETQNLSGSISVKLKGTSSNNPSLTTEAEKTIPLYDYIKNNADTTTTIDFSKTSKQDNTNGIYMTTDTEGNVPVYYYRGNVDNRVIFANFCWRIVRTTETGGVKLIYDGMVKEVYETTVPIEESSYINVSNDETYPYIFDSTTKTWVSTNKTDEETGVITFSVNTAGNYVLSYTMSSEEDCDIALFYKNGTKLEEHSGAEEGQILLTGLTTSDIITVEYTKDDSVSSGNDTVTFNIGKGVGESIKSCNNTGDNSTIGISMFNGSYDNAKYVGYMYGSSIDDETYTHDSDIKTTIDNWYETNMTSYTSQLEDTVFCNDRSYTTSGSTLFFGAYTRLHTNKTPTLKCQNTKDKFTINTSNGNGALTYPVGLITADEMVYAGGKYYSSSSDANSSFYLYPGYTGSYFWALSPYYIDYSTAYEFGLESDGYVYFATTGVTSRGVRPSVSLQPGIAMTVGGSGTAAEPFVIG